MSTLIVDNSNGRTKFALARSGALCSSVRVMPTSALISDCREVQEILSGWTYEHAVLCSVVPVAAAALETYLAQQEGISVHRLSAASLPMVDFSAYEGLSALGADRMANAAAAASLYPDTALCVIDAGTATTLDVVLPQQGASSRFLGGAIAPGLGTLARALHQQTAQLPEIPLTLPSHAIGRNTREALQNGCVRAYPGMLRHIIREMEAECGCRLQLLATGGDAPLLAELMAESMQTDPLLTLRGIALSLTEKC